MEYGTGSFIFDKDTIEKETKYLPYDVSDVTLEKILSQHYHTNYRIAYIILKYGEAAGILILFSLFLLIAMLYKLVLTIKNPMGFILSAISASAISMQIVMYVIGNFGYQFGSFPVLPFVTEGISSTIVNMLFTGIIMAAYRYDRVIDMEMPEIMKKESVFLQP